MIPHIEMHIDKREKSLSFLCMIRGIYPSHRHKREESRLTAHVTPLIRFPFGLSSLLWLEYFPLSAHRTVARALIEVRLLILEWHLPSVILKVCLLLDELLFLSDDELRSSFSLPEVPILVLRSSRYTLNR